MTNDDAEHQRGSGASTPILGADKLAIFHKRFAHVIPRRHTWKGAKIVRSGRIVANIVEAIQELEDKAVSPDWTAKFAAVRLANEALLHELRDEYRRHGGEKLL